MRSEACYLRTVIPNLPYHPTRSEQEQAPQASPNSMSSWLSLKGRGAGKGEEEEEQKASASNAAPAPSLDQDEVRPHAAARENHAHRTTE